MREKKHVLPLLLAIAMLVGVIYLIRPSGPLDGKIAWEDLASHISSLWQDTPTLPSDPISPVEPSDPIAPNEPTTPDPTPAEPVPSEPPTPTEPDKPKDPPSTTTPDPKPVEPEQPTPPVSGEYQYSCDVSAYLPAISTQYDNILLVNKSHPLGENYVPANLIYLPTQWTIGSKAIQLDATASAALEAMMLCMRADGITDTYVTSGYRNYAYQLSLQNAYIREEMQNDSSLSRAEAKEIVLTYSAEPGKSEHQSGLCVDFITATMTDLTNDFERYEAFTWLKENACQFGFILRYPANKVNVTKYSYESWHYRFVGREAAIAITEAGLTLEEYLSK